MEVLIIVAICTVVMLIVINILITRSLIKKNNETALEQVKINLERINDLEVANDLFNHLLHDLIDKYTALFNDFTDYEENIQNQIKEFEENLKINSANHDVNASKSSSDISKNITKVIENLVEEKKILIKQVDQVRNDLENISALDDPQKKVEVKYKLSMTMKDLQLDIAEYQKREKEILKNIIP